MCTTITYLLCIHWSVSGWSTNLKQITEFNISISKSVTKKLAWLNTITIEKMNSLQKLFLS